MLEWRRVSGVAGVVVAFLACAESETRPGTAPDCNDPACVEGRGPIVINGNTVPGDDGAGGGAGGSGMPQPNASTLTGSVRAVSSPDLESDVAVVGTLVVRARGSASDDVVTDTSASGTFVLDDVSTEPDLWVGVGAFNPAAPGNYMDTLQVLNRAQSSGAVRLLVMQRQVMDQIVQFFTSAPALDPGRGHAIVTLLDATGVPIQAARVTAPAAPEASIAYDAGDLYSDQTGETSTRGTLVLLNLAAAPYPGVLTTIVAETQLERYEVAVRIATGSVSLVTAKVAP